jgi:dipeptidyl-peptidase-4
VTGTWTSCEKADDALHAALLLPSWYTDGPLPVLLDPYGGPHARRVRQSARGFLVSQWFAEAGLAVLVIDGRGTPGRGLAWEHAVHRDLATPALDDQERGLGAAARRWPLLDLDRVAIRGWSFGGFLAALAVLRRPDVFHAAVAGAPVTDWRRYDTHYTERYLGHPDSDPDAYDRSSLLADAPSLRRPLLLLHGLGDDNVVAAHSVALSDALLSEGRPHCLLPLSATTHVTRDPVRRARLLEIQLRFIRAAVGLAPRPDVPQ